MTTILENLYLGDLDDAYDTQSLQDKKVTHILTVAAKPLPRDKVQSLTYKFIHAQDMYDNDLLNYFEEAIAFIEDGRQAGGILVHCFAGQSRSSTIVLAYIMKKLNMELKDSLTLLKKLRPGIRPNDGFLSQLELFELMGNKIDKSHSQYKLYKLSTLALKMQTAQSGDHLTPDVLSADPSLSSTSDESLYKCRKCRRPLFRKCGVLPHMTGQGDVAFSEWKSRTTQAIESDKECIQSLFIEPVCWMARDILQMEGKLSCPKCHAKIGSFNWFGERCPCGTWIIPAFHIQNGKVDECKHCIPFVRQQQSSTSSQGVKNSNLTQVTKDNLSLTCMDKIDGSCDNTELPPLDT